ncbi:MAG: hypothetical protein JWM56_787 [Candidatus Peribacteria bacterium]|nr:hypothetical protein [Candidatus Peribacteria bacterium]
MKLLFITQKLHGQDAFGALWIREFERRGYAVEVICLEARPELIQATLGTDAPFAAAIHSLGKENGTGKVRQILLFLRLILMLRYDRVFIHMAPVWGLFGAPVWVLRRVPVYLWYTHYTMQAGLWLLGLYARRMFCATPQSLPQYDKSPKKIVTGHGIDLQYWPARKNVSTDPCKLLVVHRLSRSKRLELIIRALALLPDSYTLDVYGVEAEKEYVAEMHRLVQEVKLMNRVVFHGSVPSKELPELYVQHGLILNMASETIDKTMLEAMTCGCYPVTTKGNAEAIGIPAAPVANTPEAIRDFVLTYCEHPPLGGNEMYALVAGRHSLTGLVQKMNVYIASGA